jgi:metal iron transporter
MPHSLYLGSGLVQARLQDYDIRHGFWAPSSALTPVTSFGTSELPTALEREMQEEKYQPSLAAIRHCLPYSLVELIFSLATFALFINSYVPVAHLHHKFSCASLLLLNLVQ